MPKLRDILDGKTMINLEGASEGAKHVGKQVQDPFGQTKDMFDEVHKKKMEYELAKQNLIHQTAPTRAVLDRVSQIHNLDQQPVSMNTEPMLQPNPMDTEMGMNNDPNADPLAQDPAMGQQVNQGKAGQQIDPASRTPMNMNQTPGQMNMNRPSQAGFQPGVSPGPAESVRPGLMGKPTPGIGKPGQVAGTPSQQFNPAAQKPQGAGQLPGAKGPGDPKVQNKVKKAQSNSNSKGNNNSSGGSGGGNGKVNIQVHANTGVCAGARSNLTAAMGLEKLRSCGDASKMEAYGTSDGVRKAWDMRQRRGDSYFNPAAQGERAARRDDFVSSKLNQGWSHEQVRNEIGMGKGEYKKTYGNLSPRKDAPKPYDWTRGTGLPAGEKRDFEPKEEMEMSALMKKYKVGQKKMKKAAYSAIKRNSVKK